jgi:hypothetical protein
MPHRWSVELLETVVFKPAGFIGFQTVTDKPVSLMTIDDKMSAFSCASVRFPPTEPKVLKTHFDQ